MIIFVKVKPGSAEEKIQRIKEREYHISIKERAEDGKANSSLTSILSKEFSVNFKDILIKNKTGRKKIIEIKGI